MSRLRVDWRLLLWAARWSVASLIGFGAVSAIIPDPVFGRQIPALHEALTPAPVRVVAASAEQGHEVGIRPMIPRCRMALLGAGRRRE